MNAQQICKDCRQPLPGDAPEGLCPACLAKVALDSKPLGPEATINVNSLADQAGPRTPVPPTPADLAAHFPQLEILELLGMGGMGTVYKARQPRLDRLVALKILPLELAAHPSFAERFNREARALAKLNHPGIVAVYDFGLTAQYYYFIMEYVDGMNLRALLKTRTVEPAQALQLVIQICGALQFAHDEGVVHRDIKPENILLNKKGQVKIADFGLAKLLGAAPDTALTMSQAAMGTLNYMAPEQRENAQKVDHRADIYSLGVVFYEMLTGEVPMGRFEAPSKKVRVDVRLDEVVLHALEREPQRRYQTAIAVKNDVDTICESPAAEATPPDSQSSPGPGGSGRPQFYWTGAVALLCVGWVFAAAMWNFRNVGLGVAIVVLSAIYCWIAVWRVPHVCGNKKYWAKSGRWMRGWLLFNAFTGALLGFFFLFSAIQNDWERSSMHWNRSGVTEAEFEARYKGREYQLLRQLSAFRGNIPNAELQGGNSSWGGGWHIWGQSPPHNRLFDATSVLASLSIGAFGLLLAAFGIFAPPHFFGQNFSWEVLRVSLAVTFCGLITLLFLYEILVIGSFSTDPVWGRGHVIAQRGVFCEPSASADQVETALQGWARTHGYAMGDFSHWNVVSVPQGRELAHVALLQFWKPSPFARWEMTWQGLHRKSPHIVVEYISADHPAETHISITPPERIAEADGTVDPWTAEILDLKKTLASVGATAALKPTHGVSVVP